MIRSWKLAIRLASAVCVLSVCGACNLVASFIVAGAEPFHVELAEFLDVDDLDQLQTTSPEIEGIVEGLLLSKFPIGTPFDTLLAEIPAADGPLNQGLPWAWDASAAAIRIESAVPPQVFSYTCSGVLTLNLRFLDGFLSSVEAVFQVGCF